MNPKYLIKLLIFLCVNAVALSASAGVMGSLAGQADLESVSTEPGDSAVRLLFVHAEKSSTGTSTQFEAFRAEVLLGTSSVFKIMCDEESRQKAYSSPMGYVPTPVPDPLLKIPIL